MFKKRLLSVVFAFVIAFIAGCGIHVSDASGAKAISLLVESYCYENGTS